MDRYFDISEFLVEKDTLISGEIADKIQKHIDIINPIRIKINIPIHVSQGSGYRTRQYELKMDRSGTSQHVFIRDGAADYTCANLKALYDNLIVSEYKRIAFYPDEKIIHCDFNSSEQRVFLSFKKEWHFMAIENRDYSDLLFHHSFLKKNS